LKEARGFHAEEPGEGSPSVPGRRVRRRAAVVTAFLFWAQQPGDLAVLNSDGFSRKMEFPEGLFPSAAEYFWT
jgi:hypothetical protein